MSSLNDFDTALRDIGYPADLIRRDYRYATAADSYANPQSGTAEVEMAAFCRFPPTYRDACFGVTFSNGQQGVGNVARHRSLGASQVFEVNEDARVVTRWSMRAGGPPVPAGPGFPLARIREVFQEYRAAWNLESMRAAKRGGASAEQREFFDALLLPQLAREFQTQLRITLEGVVTSVQTNFAERFEGDKANELFPFLFRLLTAKIFQDRQDMAGWEPNLSPQELYDKADEHLSDHHQGTPGIVFDENLINAGWLQLSGGLQFANLSAADLAYIYESCFIDTETRKRLSIHSTPQEVADYVVEHLPLGELPEGGRKVLEPFCGSGVFLSAAMRRLGELTTRDLTDLDERHRYFRERLVGVEYEALAREVCRMRLTLSDYPNGNGWRLYSDDVFRWGGWESEDRPADIVLANPPFHSLLPADRANYHARKAVAPAELLRRVMRRPPEMLGMVLPPSFLTGPDYREANRELARTFKVIEYVELPAKVFVYAGRETTLLLCSGRRSAQFTGARKVKINAKRVGKHLLDAFYHEGRISWEVTQTKTLSETDRNFTLRVDPPDDIWELLKKAPLLGEEATIRKGINWKARMDGLPARSRRTDVVSSRPLPGYHPGCEKSRGCLRQFSLCPPAFLSLREEDQNPADRAWDFAWDQPKVVCNRGRGRRESPWRLAAFADTLGLAFTQAYLCIWPRERIGPHALAAVLCGPLANLFMRERDTGADNRGETLKCLPLPPLSALAPDGPIDQLSAKLHRLSAPSGELDFGGEVAAHFEDLILRLDAAVLEAYSLPVKHERRILDQFSGWERPVSSRTPLPNAYFRTGFKTETTLADYLAITRDWRKHNDRRFQLIFQRRERALNPTESVELDRLQELTDKLIELEDIYSDKEANLLIEQLKQQGLWK